MRRILIICSLLLINPCLAAVTNLESLLGGYTAVTDLSDPVVVEAANFVLQEAAQLQANDAKYSFEISVEDSSADVILASQQVVAGLNLKLIIVVEDSKKQKSCQGAFLATIYDHFGSFEVTEWGNEFTCQEAKAIEKNENAGNEGE
jgi:hypothetical protein